VIEMKQTIRLIVTGLVAALLSGAIPATGSAGNRGRAAHAPRKTASVTVVGTYTGALTGNVRVGSREVVISKQTRIYKTDRGMLRGGARVVDSPVYIICKKQRGKLLAQLVIVSNTRISGQKGDAGVLSPDANW
jgi:hypothetical protein